MDGMQLCAFVFHQAAEQDAAAVLSLYRAVKGTPFCTWDDFYPTEREVSHDISAGKLYILTCRETVVGAVTVVPENELDGYTLWQKKDNAREIARVAVLPQYQGHALALRLVAAVEELLRKDGIRAVHLLAAVDNPPAWKTYEKALYHRRGRVFAYGIDFYAYEKSLADT